MRFISVWFLLVSISGAVDLALNLPTWSDEARKVLADDTWIPCAGLLVASEADQPNDVTEIHPPTSAEMTDPVPANEIPDEFLDAYFANRPEVFLIDPQGLLDPTAKRERLAFLNYHSADSQIDFHVYVFGPEQDIPGEVRGEEISERLFNEGRPSLTLFYYLGAPERSEIFLSQKLTDSVSDAERRRILQSSVLAASEKSDSISQLEAFCVQTSIRIYWIEKAAGLLHEHPPAPMKKAEPSPVLEDPSRLGELRRSFDVFWWHWGAITMVSSAGGLIALASWWMMRRRTKYRFPEFEVASRLGGAHAAGIGAVIGFGSTTQSPSSQHQGMTDYFGGI